jgi:phosphopantetheine adenylyltransferase
VTIRVLVFWKVAPRRFSNIQTQNFFLARMVAKTSEIGVLVRNLRKINDFKSLVLDRLIILKWILKK